MRENVIEKLTSKNDRFSCAYAETIISESRETDKWYEYFDDFASLLGHPKSLVRNRALRILAANAQWDKEDRFDRILPDYLSHITDEKPITARQCIQALAQVGLAKPQYIGRIRSGFRSADLSKYKDTMRPLMEKDIAKTEEVLTSLVYELKDTSKVKELFANWPETLILSCLQKVMGKIYVTDTDNPVSAFAFVGCFGFFAGKPDRSLAAHKPDGFVILAPQNEAWAALIEECYPSAKKVQRFAIKKDTKFDIGMLQAEISKLPPEYELRQIDSAIYDQCLESPVTADFVSAFESKEQYLEIGRGMVILKDGKIVSGASSYTRYREGIEIEVDTVESERRKHLATIACSALILRCLEEGLYPSWDAQNMHSVHLAEKLGYEFDHAYTAYEVT